MPKRERIPPTYREIEDEWRMQAGGSLDFIGPVASGIELWMRGEGKGRYWEIDQWWLRPKDRKPKPE